jgi:hypothetical protein
MPCHYAIISADAFAAIFSPFSRRLRHAATAITPLIFFDYYATVD